MKNPVLKVENLVLAYRTTGGDIPAVDGVSFQLGRGETYGILGESGCGKTSLALALLKLLPENASIRSGRVIFNGADIIGMDEESVRKIRWTGISMIFQAAMNALNPVYTVEYQIAEAILAHEGEKRPGQITSRILALLGLAGLPPGVASKYPHQLSGGMKQRAVIAMALACSPDIIIADEPTTALDVIVQDRLLRSIKSIQKKLGTGLIYISHDVSVLEEVSDRMAVMYAGRIVEEAPADELFETPRHPYTAALIDAFPSVKGPGKKLSAVKGEPPDMLRLPAGCNFAPRCGRALPVCRLREPLLQTSGRRKAACYNPVES